LTTLLGYNTSSETHEESMTNEVPWKLGDFSPAKMGSISSYITVLCAWLYDEEKDILLTYNLVYSELSTIMQLIFAIFLLKLCLKLIASEASKETIEKKIAFWA